MIKLALLGILIVTAGWLLGTLERRSLYFPDRTPGETPKLHRLSYEDVQLATKDSVKIHGWFIPGKEKLTILLAHGNAGNISHRLDKVMRLRGTGVSILLFDYRGYGQSDGDPSEKGTYADAEAAYAYLTETQKIPPHQIVFYGESIGCAIALEMATRHPVAGLILESPFTSTVDMAKLVFPWLPVRWMVRYRYDNLSKISNIRIPLLMLHSPQDEIIPFSMAQTLFDQAPEPKRLVELTGGHNDGYEVSGQVYTQSVAQFLKGVRHD